MTPSDLVKVVQHPIRHKMDHFSPTFFPANHSASTVSNKIKHNKIKELKNSVN